jgi:hypothetical protein
MVLGWEEMWLEGEASDREVKRSTGSAWSRALDL